MSDRAQTFSMRTLVILGAVGGVAAVASIVFSIFGDGLGRRTIAPSAFSESALGYGSLVEVLRAEGFPVVVSTNETRRKATDGALLVLAEPFPGPQTEAIFDRLLGAPNVLLILPKWFGEAWSGNSRWVGNVRRIDRSWPQDIINRVDPGATVLRTSGVLGPGVSLGPRPTLVDAQLIQSGGGSTAIGSNQGRLLVRYDFGTNRLWVLTDPDLLNNHGIDNGANADLAVFLLSSLAPAGGAIIFDETIHGFIDGNALWRAALRPPFLVPTLVAGIAIVLLLWASVGRIGRALPDDRPIPAGHAALIDNTADLLVVGRRDKQLMRNYLEQTKTQVARMLHIKRTDRMPQRDRLDEIAEQRGIDLRYGDLAARVEQFIAESQPGAGGARALAADIYRWKEEMTDGS